MKKTLLLVTVVAAAALAQTGPHWVATWTTPQPLVRNQPAGQRAGGPPAPATDGAPSLTPQAINSRGFHDQTVRMILRTSIGGAKARIKVANPFGSMPVKVGAAAIAIRAKDTEIVEGSSQPVTFSGKSGILIGPGVVMLSDPVDLAVPAQADLAVSIYLPDDTGSPASHNGLHTSYVSRQGDQTRAASIPDAISVPGYFWLAGVDVMAPANASAIVALGDSITEGARSTPDTNSMWPAVLSARLSANKNTANFAVANMGIGGNRVLRDGSGASALARFDRDVLSQSGVKWLIMLEGINDIGHGNTEPVTAEELIGAFKQVIERAHEHGISVVGCTLPPYEGANYARPEGEAIRAALNTWIRTGKAFDAVVDFEAATKDPNNPTRIRADFDPGDHLHPNDAGYRAMGESIDLSIFTRKAAK